MKEREYDALNFPDLFEVYNENQMIERWIDSSKASAHVYPKTRKITLLRILDIKDWFRTKADFLKFSQKMRQKYNLSRVQICIEFDTVTYPAYPIELVLYEAIYSLKKSKIDVKKYKTRVKAAVYKKRKQIITEET